MKACTIYHIKNKILIVCMHETDAKFYKLAEPIKLVDSGDNPIEIGNAILEILNCSKKGLPSNSTGLGIAPIILKASGAKSWRKFESESTECMAQLGGDTVHLTPSVRIGNNAAIHQADQIVKSTTSPEELGKAVLNLLVK